MVDWKNIEMPLPDLAKYILAVGPVLAALIVLCIQVGSYKTKVDSLIFQNQAQAEQLRELSLDMAEVKSVLKIRQNMPPQSYTDSIDPALSKLRPERPQVSGDKFYEGMDTK